MEQTPPSFNYNPDLLKFIPKNISNLIEVGCSYGGLAREYKKINPECKYIGVDIDNSYLREAKKYCDEVICINIDYAEDDFYKNYKDFECWIFGDTLEHTKDPWKILKKIRNIIPKSGSIIACIPNIQHWSYKSSYQLVISDIKKWVY